MLISWAARAELKIQIIIEDLLSDDDRLYCRVKIIRVKKGIYKGKRIK